MLRQIPTSGGLFRHEVQRRVAPDQASGASRPGRRNGNPPGVHSQVRPLGLSRPPEARPLDPIAGLGPDRRRPRSARRRRHGVGTTHAGPEAAGRLATVRRTGRGGSGQAVQAPV